MEKNSKLFTEELNTARKQTELDELICEEFSVSQPRKSIRLPESPIQQRLRESQRKIKASQEFKKFTDLQDVTIQVHNSNFDDALEKHEQDQNNCGEDKTAGYFKQAKASKKYNTHDEGINSSKKDMGEFILDLGARMQTTEISEQQTDDEHFVEMQSRLTKQFQHRSSLARIKYEDPLKKTKPSSQGKKKEQEKQQIHRFADELLSLNEDIYNRKFKFENAQFHQCIPHPTEEKEFITVQIAHNVMKQVKTGKSLNEMKARDLYNQRLYQMYIFDPDEAEPAPEQIETTDGVKAHEMRKLKTDRVHDKTAFASEIGIIGLWKLNPMGKYRCYHHFKVPYPVKRDIRKKRNLRLSSVLNVGRDNDVFFFFKDRIDTKIGILNLEKANKSSQLVQEQQIVEEMKDYIEHIVPSNTLLFHHLNAKNHEDKWLIPNPTLIRGKTPEDTHIVFTSEFQYEDLSDSTANTELLRQASLISKAETPRNELKIKKGKACSIFFYQLQTEKEVIQITGGVQFLKHDNRQIRYLACKQGLAGDFQSISVNTVEIPKDMFNLFVVDEKNAKHLKSIPLTFDKKSLIQWKSSVSSLCNVIEATLHNDDKRITIAVRDTCAFTFLLPTTDELAQLIFQKLDSTDVKIVKKRSGLDASGKQVDGTDVYVQTQLKSYDTEEEIRTGDSYAESSLTFHQVSWDLIKDKDGKIEPDQHPTERMPHFRLVQSFARANWGVNDCFVESSAPLITAKNEIIGAILFEKPHRKEVTLNWYFTSLIPVKDGQLKYPQERMKQSFIVNYPMLAYKEMSPDNSKISLVHLAEEIPQRIVNLGDWEFISFVHNSNENIQEDCKINFLVGNKGRIKLLMIRLDPWKRIDKETPFDEPETIFEYNEYVNLPTKKDECFKENLFTNDKLKNIMLLQNTIAKTCQITLSLQYRHCILTTSLNTNKFQIIIKSPEMVKKLQVRGDEDEVFYARNSGDRDTIVKLQLYDHILDKIITTDIFEMDARLVCFEQEQDYNVLKKFNKNEMKKQICILNSKLKLKTIKQQDGDELYKVEQETDFTGHKLSRRVQSDWSSVILSHKAITDGPIVYKANQDQPGATNGSKSYFWNARCHTDNTTALKNAKFDVKSSGRIPQSTTMISVIQEKSKKDSISEDFFLVKPSPGVRNLQLSRFDTSMPIQNMFFISNDHVLVQFKNKSVPLKDAFGKVKLPDDSKVSKVNQSVVFAMNGKMISQPKDVSEALENEIIGSSQKGKGNMTFVLRNEAKENTVTLVQFEENGVGKIHQAYRNLEQQIYDELINENNNYKDQEENIKRGLRFQNDILVTEKGDLVVIGRYQQEVEKQKDEDDEGEVENIELNQHLTTEDETKKVKYGTSPFSPKLQSQSPFSPGLLKSADRHPELQAYASFSTLTRRSSTRKSSLNMKEKKEKEDKKKEMQRKNDLKTPNEITVHKVQLKGEIQPYDSEPETTTFTVVVMTQKYQKREEVKVGDKDGENLPQPKVAELLFSMQTELIGPFIAYRSTADDKIHFNKILDLPPEVPDDEQNEKDAGKCCRRKPKKKKSLRTAELDKLIKPQHELDLSQIFTGKNDSRFVNIASIPNSSFLYVSYCIEAEDERKSIMSYKNLFQVTVRNRALIFKIDLDGKGPQELNYIENLQQLMDPNSLVNTGSIQAVITKHQKNDGQIMNIAKMNRSSSLYFMNNTADSIVRAFGSEKNRLKKKRSTYEQAGIVYRTCSEIDLLDLAQINTAIENKEVFSYIDIDTMLSTYEGHTIFSIYWNALDLYSTISDQLESLDFDEQILEKKSYENPTLRRLYRLLKIPTMDLKPEIYKDAPNLGMYCTKCQASLRQQNDVDKAVKWKDKVVRQLKIVREWCTQQKERKACTVQCRGYKPISVKSVMYTNEKFRDCLIRIAILCEETEIMTFVNTFDDMKALFFNHSPAVQLLLDAATCATEYCKNINVLSLYGSKKKQVVRSQQSFVNTQYIQDLIKQGTGQEWIERLIIKFQNLKRLITGQERENVSVIVRMLKVAWILRDRTKGQLESVQYFIKALVDKEDQDEMLSSEFIMTIVDEIWSTHKYGLFLLCFVPFLLLWHASIYFFSICMSEQSGTNSGFQGTGSTVYWRFILQTEIIVWSLYLFYFEVKQLIDKRLAYFFNLQNLLELASTILNIYLVILNVRRDYQTPLEEFLHDHSGRVNNLCSIAVALMWFRLFKWMRFFPELGYYTRLLSQTMWDIRYFMILLVMVVSTFSNVMFILNNQQHVSEGISLYDEQVDNTIANSWLSQYLWCLGEFSMEFSGQNEDLLWVIFICSTFMIQITFLNMLIAIMGNTYDKVKASMKVAKLRERIDILQEYNDVLELMRHNFTYFFITRPSNVQEDAVLQWEGNISTLKSVINSNHKKIDQKINYKFKQFEHQLTRLNVKSQEQVKIIRHDVFQSKEAVKIIKHDVSQSKEAVDRIERKQNDGLDKIYTLLSNIKTSQAQAPM